MESESLGFTLVELLVSIAIFGLLLTAAVVNLRGSSPNREVRSQAQNLVSLLQQAQSFSLSGEASNGSTPVGGFGMSIEVCEESPCRAVLFSDDNGNFSYDDPEESREILDFGQQITVNSISFANAVDIVFKPPSALICFNGQCTDINQIEIELGHPQSSIPRTVFINQVSGQISFQ